jgi:hypothetical protein
MVLALAVAVAIATVPGQAQRNGDRQSGPRDWSHGRVVATRFGPDQDKKLNRDFRTFLKHAQLEQAETRRSARVASGETLQKLEMEQRQASIHLGWFRTQRQAQEQSLPALAPQGWFKSRQRLENERRAELDWWKNEQARLEEEERRSLDAYKTEQERVEQASRPHLDWSLRTGGYGSVVGYPAKFSFDIAAANCSDDVYFTVDQAGGPSTVNVVGLTNIYAGCLNNSTGATPTVKFGIRMGTGTATSAVPSLDGTILYVIESRVSGAGMILHAINVDRITASVGTYSYASQLWSNAHVLDTVTGPTREQLFEIAFAGVTNSVASPFLDYGANQLFFGDSSGEIHRVINVNLASASKAPNFPVSCGSAVLQSPVFVGGQIITSSADGRLYRIDTTAAAPHACIASAPAGNGLTAGPAGGLSPPVVDVSNSKILVASNSADLYDLAGIGTFGLNFAANAVPSSVAFLGQITATAPNAPSFDNAFWTTNNGNVYAVGSPLDNDNTYLIRLPYNGTILGEADGFAGLQRTGSSTSNVATSPVTEFLTASTLAKPDFIFVGGGSGTYKFMNRIGSGFDGSALAPVNMAGNFAVPGGVVSGIIIDTRTAGVTGSMATANIYFGTVGVGPSTTMSTIVQLAQQF